MKRNRRRLKIIVTYGATREPIDPVRFITNCATGYLGYQIAQAAQKRGHRVLVVSTEGAQAKPSGARTIVVVTARQMQEVLKTQFNWCDCLIMTAAVSDFRAKKVARRKLTRAAHRELTLRLRRNPDILAGLGKRKGQRILVGCSLETEGLKKKAQQKLYQKNLDLIVATQKAPGSYPFGRASLSALILAREGRLQKVRRVTKARLAGILLDRIEEADILARWPRS